MFRIVIGLKVVAVCLFLIMGVHSSGADAEGRKLESPKVVVGYGINPGITYATFPRTRLATADSAPIASVVEVVSEPGVVSVPKEPITKNEVSSANTSRTTQVVAQNLQPTTQVVKRAESTTAAPVPLRTPAPAVADSGLFSDLIATIVTNTNQARTREQSAPLTLSSSLSAAATKRSLDMARRDYFAHETPDGCDLECHTEMISFDATSWGENIAWYEPYFFLSETELGAHFVREWLKSSGHRRNMLNRDFTHQGIGLALDGEKIIVTVIFATAN
jgi:uncharacterized protein YkwD